MAERLCSLRIAMAERDAKILADEGDAMRARVAACRRRLLGLPKHRPTFLVAMQMGIEPIVMDEITSSLAAAYTVPPLITLTVAPYGARGFIGVSFTDEAITAEASASSNPAHDISAVAKVQAVLLKLRSAIDVLLFHAIFDLPPPRTTNVAEQIYQHIVRLPGDPVPPLGNASVTGFRVTTSRCGHHSFTSKEIEFEAGGGLAERYKEAKGHGIGTWVNVRVDVIADKVVVATQINLHDLSRRHKNGYVNRVTIKTNLAAVMLRLADAAPGFRILDPFCGSGTILLEAADIFNKEIAGVGSDSVSKTVEGAQKNAEMEGYGGCLRYVHCSAVALTREFVGQRFDAIITNPPWGTGKNTDLELLYRKFLSGATNLLRPGGKMVVLVLKALQFLEITRTYGQFKLLQTYVVKTRNNLPTIFVFERREADEERESLRRQLHDLGQYVDISTDIFQAIHSSSGGGGGGAHGGGGGGKGNKKGVGK
eukprot:gene10412-3652_t